MMAPLPPCCAARPRGLRDCARWLACPGCCLVAAHSLQLLPVLLPTALLLHAVAACCAAAAAVSTGMFFDHGHDAVIARVEERVALVSMVPASACAVGCGCCVAAVSAWHSAAAAAAELLLLFLRGSSSSSRIRLLGSRHGTRCASSPACCSRAPRSLPTRPPGGAAGAALHQRPKVRRALRCAGAATGLRFACLLLLSPIRTPVCCMIHPHCAGAVVLPVLAF